jgi:hypothetical protein
MTANGEPEMFDVEGTALRFGIRPADGKVGLTAQHAGDTVASGTYALSVFTDPGERNKFLSSVETALEARPSVDASGARTKLKQALAEFGRIAEEERDQFRDLAFSEATNEIIDGTNCPVQVFRGDPTTWAVTLTFQGETRTLEFTTGEMNGSGGALEEKIANHFLKFVDIGADEWEEIREVWAENKEVIDTGGETANDAVATRVLEHLGDGVLPTRDREMVANAPSNAWLDAENTAGYDDAPATATIVWVQGRYLADKLESASKSVEYRGQLVQDLIRRGDLYGKSTRRRWSDGTRRRYYPFTPEALKLDPEQVGDPDDGSATSEVEP